MRVTAAIGRRRRMPIAAITAAINQAAGKAERQNQHKNGGENSCHEKHMGNGRPRTNKRQVKAR